MALPDLFKIAQGTAIVFGQASGSGVTNAFSLNNLASAAGQMGSSVDLGALWDEEFLVSLIVETGTAPSAGLTVELFLACSYDNATWPGKVTGSDAAYPATIANNKKQLGTPVSILVATPDTNTILVQQPVIWRPQGRYIAPVVVNLFDVTFRNEGTPANNDSRVILVPRKFSIED